MIKRLFIWGLLWLGLGCSTAWAQVDPGLIQNVGTIRDTVDVFQDQPFQLHTFILPGSAQVVLNGAPLDTTQYRLNERYGLLRIDGLTPDSSTVLVAVYRTLPFVFRPAYYRRRFTPVDPDSIRMTGIIIEETQATPTYDLFGDSKLERHGSITRGIIAGNNRDVSLESGLRVQLAGEVTEGVNVRAVLTDENTPIQPDGTTQRLNEFDKVFIQLEANRGIATLGDFDLRFQGSEFAVFNRKLQGISLLGNIPDVTGDLVGDGTVTVAGATARGIFNAQEVVALDGVQGPYRLEGREGERFIIVIAGSERVYLDGQLLTRGETQDYIIDYATGEVTFTSRHIISDDKRITVEFEYTTNRFTRTQLGAEARLNFWQREDGSARFRFSTTALQEADSRSFSEELGISSSDSLALVNAGDGFAFGGGAEQVTFNPEANYVQYVKRDTLFNGELIQDIYVPLQDTAAVDSVFRVQFTRVSEGTGDYRREGQSLNGILFTWVGPNNGDYIARRLLPKPKLQRLIDFSGVLEPVRGLELFGEWARSVNDLNRFSDLDAADDIDGAFVAGVRVRPTRVLLGDRDFGQVSAEFRKRSTGDYFEAFGRTRTVEFGRRWNLNRSLSATGAGGEDMTEFTARWDVRQRSSITGEWGNLGLGSGFDGSRIAVEARSEEIGLPQVQYRLESIESFDSLRAEQGTWLRQRGRMQQTFLDGRLTPAFEVEQENRKLRGIQTGDLTRQSVAFTEWRPGVTLNFDRVQATGTLEYRTEKGIADGVLRDRASAWTGQVQFSLKPHPNFTTDADVGYRVKRFTDDFPDERDGESVAVRWNSRFTPFQRAVQMQWFYEALTEKTPLLQETYVRVGPEIGQFVWVDDNGDGIRQVDEFLPETLPNEGVYVRSFVPSDELQPVINVQARMRLILTPSRLWNTVESGWKKWLSNISTQTTVEVLEKSKEEQLKNIYLLNLSEFRGDETINGRLRLDQRLELFKGESRFGTTLIFNELRNLNQLSAGREERFQRNWRFDGRFRPGRAYGLRFIGSLERSQALSAQFASRTFDIRSVNAEPEVSINLRQTLQVTLGMAYSNKTDSRPGGTGRDATIWKYPVQVIFTRARRLQLTLRAERSDVQLDGEAVGLAAFELTDGRGAGTSYLWNLSGRYDISSLIRASLFYDGRAPSDAPTIHTVRLQFSLVF